MIFFRYDGEPVGKGRPRVTARGGKFAHAYTPKKSKDFEDAIRFAFMSSTCEKMPVYDKEIPLKAEMVFGFSVPKSYSKKRRKACLDGLEMHTKKPDADNVCKSCLDALSGVAFFDDSQVVSLVLEKRYAEEPFVEIGIYPLENADEDKK